MTLAWISPDQTRARGVVDGICLDLEFVTTNPSETSGTDSCRICACAGTAGTCMDPESYPEQRLHTLKHNACTACAREDSRCGYWKKSEPVCT